MSTNTATSSSAAALPARIAGEAVSDDQHQWLDGYFSGLGNQGLSFAQADPAAGPQPLVPAEKKTKLTAEEKLKQEMHPFDALPVLRRRARLNEQPEKEDIFRFKWNGLFWLGPVHEGYMCRLRIPGGKVDSSQLRELASIADDIAWGYLQLTTRNNFQIRVVEPKDAPELLRRIQDCGLHSRGTGADNLRNFTANPSSGFDPHELLDVMPNVDDLANYIVNHNEFYDLPRKFNVSYDGGGLIGVAEDTNDIGLRAFRLKEPPEGHPLHGKVSGGIWYRILLGGVTGHQEFAECSGAICRPEDSTEVVAALTRVFIRNGNRGNRGKARMIYLLKDWGLEKYLDETDTLLTEAIGEPLTRFDFSDPAFADLIEEHDKPVVPHPHIGAQAQKQDGLNWLGVYIPVGILQTDEARAIAEVADEFGNGELRLTIFQNLLIPNIPDDQLEAARSKLADAGLGTEASFVRGGVAACTGNRHCKFASSDTKGHSIEVVDFLEQHITLDQPINIHVTGCPHSCAQHYIGDLGLLACKVKDPDNPDGDSLEGYHVFVGGGFCDNNKLGRQLFKSVAAGDPLNHKILAILTSYLTHRQPDEAFIDFTSRHDIDELAAMTEAQLQSGASFETTSAT